jgi:hypothetical protein
MRDCRRDRYEPCTRRKPWPIPMKPPVMQGASPARTPSLTQALCLQGAIVMSDVMSENVAKLIAILATFSRTVRN